MDWIRRRSSETAEKKNARSRSVDIQNEIVGICGDVLKTNIITNVKKAESFNILADEKADISGSEQLSIDIRYFDEETNKVEVMFVGFIELKALEAKSISQTIDKYLSKENLDPLKMRWFGIWWVFYNGR